MAKQRQIFVYDDREDADIMRWLDAQENKSAAIREAIRATLHPQQARAADLGGIRRVVREELARVNVQQAGAGAGQGTPQAGDVDPAAGAILDEMF